MAGHGVSHGPAWGTGGGSTPSLKDGSALKNTPEGLEFACFGICPSSVAAFSSGFDWGCHVRKFVYLKVLNMCIFLVFKIFGNNLLPEMVPGGGAVGGGGGPVGARAGPGGDRGGPRGGEHRVLLYFWSSTGLHFEFKESSKN